MSSNNQPRCSRNVVVEMQERSTFSPTTPKQKNAESYDSDVGYDESDDDQPLELFSNDFKLIEEYKRNELARRRLVAETAIHRKIVRSLSHQLKRINNEIENDKKLYQELKEHHANVTADFTKCCQNLSGDPNLFPQILQSAMENGGTWFEEEEKMKQIEKNIMENTKLQEDAHKSFAEEHDNHRQMKKLLETMLGESMNIRKQMKEALMNDVEIPSTVTPSYVLKAPALEEEFPSPPTATRPRYPLVEKREAWKRDNNAHRKVKKNATKEG